MPSHGDALLKDLETACTRAGLRVSGPWSKSHGLELHIWQGDRGGPVIRVTVDTEWYEAAVGNENPQRLLRIGDLQTMVEAVTSRTTVRQRRM
jgi:hypothetical protein